MRSLVMYIFWRSNSQQQLCLSRFSSAAVPLLLGVSIAAPLALVPGQDAILSCRIVAATGNLEVLSSFLSCDLSVWLIAGASMLSSWCLLCQICK